MLESSQSVREGLSHTHRVMASSAIRQGNLGRSHEALACLAASGVLEAPTPYKEGKGMKWCRFQVGHKVSYGIVEN